ncbi:TetR/AcrR family transcriptional regulator [Actinacidiphila acidipaludis]|uniref:TetR/AcrR family transcriptional regulator n=1 Tax=Actinacidiphila acidipaludis TaxID=2873382 RepID=A0ABS7QEN7_9ACTN|nr:TetR/AcrR family transcriptional regulator [Streptomyces acidipaludis]MBY8881632.1 TetR/AcrR family transcriptional regulator [Streptomyces acidipaludis]
MPAQKRLNRDELVATAMSVVDAEGLEAVTVRRVAQQHDVTPMALYRHFDDKDGLLDAVAERVLDDVRLPAADDRPWHEQMADLLTAFLDAMRPHPNATPLLFDRILSAESGLAITERTLTLLAEAGMSVDDGAEHACKALNFLVTLVLTEPGRGDDTDPAARDEALRAKRARLLTLDPARYPHVVAAAGPLTDCPSAEAYYRRGVESIVTAMRGPAAAAAPTAV